MSKINMTDNASLDPDALDLEWLRHPGLVANACGQLTVARRKVDDSKDELDRVESELDGKIRNDPTKYGVPLGRGDKPTETSLKQAIRGQEEYEEARQVYFDAVDQHDELKNVMTVLEHRRTALEYLVKLLGTEYFAGPTTPRDLKKEFSRLKDSGKDPAKKAAQEDLEKRSRRKIVKRT